MKIRDLPRGVYLSDHDNSKFQGTWIRANTTEHSDYTNLADVWLDEDSKWNVDLWKDGWETQPQHINTREEAINFAITLIMLGEVPYELDEGRIDARPED